MGKKMLCAFGTKIEHRLVDLHNTDKWLIEAVQKDTGKYFDRSYLHKIKTGELTTPGIIASICKVLGIKDQPETNKEATLK